MCGALPTLAEFNDEHIVPRWVLRRYGLFAKEITLPTGERRRYGGYRVPCCKACNSLLGYKVETPVSKLLEGEYADVAARLEAPGARELLFTWLTLLFLKVHLKDQMVPIHKDRRRGSEVIGDLYEWETLHHLHAVARAPYTGAHLMPGVVGSLQVFEINDPHDEEGYDYLNFTYEQTVVVRLGRIGIVAALTDAGVGEAAWSEKLAVIDGPITNLQLREVGAMFATANAALISRPQFGTLFLERSWLMIFMRRPPGRLREFDVEGFGRALLFAVRNYVAAGAIEVDGSRDPDEVSAAIERGYVRFLTDAEGRFRRRAWSTAEDPGPRAVDSQLPSA